MSFQSKWRQFVRWVDEHKKRDIDNIDFTNQPETWSEAESQAKANEFNQASKSWVTLGLFVASYLDSKAGGKSIPPGRGPVTGNNDIDVLIIVGGAIAAIVVAWKILKSMFS